MNRDDLEQLEDLFQNATVGFLVTTPDGRVLTYNRACALLTGWSWPEEADGDHTFAPELADAVDDHELAGRLAGGVPTGDVAVQVGGRRLVANTSARERDGDLVSVRWTLRPDLHQAVPSIEDDPSEYHVVPDEVLHGNDAARWAAELGGERDAHAVVAAMSDDEAEARADLLEDFFQYVPAAVHLIGIRGTVLRANATDMAVAGYADSPGDYLGSHVRQVYVDQALMDDLFGRWDRGRPILNFRTTLTSKDGDQLPVVIFSNSRLVDGAFRNTRCVVFPDSDPGRPHTPTRHFTWPSR